VSFRSFERKDQKNSQKEKKSQGLFIMGERLRELRLFSQEKSRLWGDLVAAFQYLKEAYKKAGQALFTRASSDRARGNGFKLKDNRFGLDMRKKLFTMRVVRHRNRLPRVFSCPEARCFQGQVGSVFEQPGLVEDVPAHSMGVGPR